MNFTLNTKIYSTYFLCQGKIWPHFVEFNVWFVFHFLNAVVTENHVILKHIPTLVGIQYDNGFLI